LFRKPKLAPAATGKIDNILGANTSYHGTIKADGNIRIDSVFQGHIETAGNVIVGPEAKVMADIVANAVQVWGAVRGDITTRGRLEVMAQGRVWGNVQVASLLIDEGGVFQGQCVMGGERIEPLVLPEPEKLGPGPAVDAAPEETIGEIANSDDDSGNAA